MEETIQTGEMQPAPQKIGKFRASKMIVKASWHLLMQDREVLWFPVLSVLTSVAALAIGLAVFFFVALGGDWSLLEEVGNSEETSPFSYLILFLTYFVSYFIVIFFQAGIVAIVNARINGQALSFSDGLQVAFRHAGKIAIWAALSATVGVILRAIADRSEWLGKIVSAFLGAAWGIVTFFIVPVLILEQGSVGESLRSSGETVKKMWGESIIINVGAGLVFVLLALVGIGVFVASLFTGEPGVILGAGILLFLYLMVLGIISSTLDTIFRVMLYQYAKNHIVPAGLPPEVLQVAFKRK